MGVSIYLWFLIVLCFDMKQLNFCSLPEHLSPLSVSGVLLKALSSCVDFEIFRGILNEGLRYSDGRRGVRSPKYWDPLYAYKSYVAIEGKTKEYSLAERTQSQPQQSRQSKNPWDSPMPA